MFERNSSTYSYQNESPRDFALPYIIQKNERNSIHSSERGSAFAQPLPSSKNVKVEESQILKSMGEYFKKEKESQEEKEVLGLLGKELAQNQNYPNKEKEEEDKMLKIMGELFTKGRENQEQMEKNKENQEEEDVVLNLLGSGINHSQKENQLADFQREKIEKLLKSQAPVEQNFSEKEFEKLIFKTPNISFLSHKNERTPEEAIRPHLGGNETARSLSNRSLKSFNDQNCNKNNPMEPNLEVSRLLSVPPRASANKVKKLINNLSFFLLPFIKKFKINFMS